MKQDVRELLQNLTVSTIIPRAPKICVNYNKSFDEVRHLKPKSPYPSQYAKAAYTKKYYFWCFACIQTEILLPSDDND